MDAVRDAVAQEDAADCDAQLDRHVTVLQFITRREVLGNSSGIFEIGLHEGSSKFLRVADDLWVKVFRNGHANRTIPRDDRVAIPWP